MADPGVAEAGQASKSRLKEPEPKSILLQDQPNSDQGPKSAFLTDK